MITRISLWLCLSVLWTLAFRTLVAPVSVLARQSAAVATVQSSDVAYVAQHAIENGGGALWMAMYAGLLLIATLCFYSPLRRALRGPATPAQSSS